MHTHLRRPAVALLTTALAAGALGFAPAATAVPTGTIHGTVTAAGAPVEGVEVTAYAYYYDDDDGYGYWGSVAYWTTDEQGGYSLDLPEGEYRVGFQDVDGRYVEEFFDNAPSLDSPEAVTLTASAAAPVDADADLQAAAHITGAVSGTGSAPLQGIQVTAYREVVEFAGTEDEYVDYWDAGQAWTDALGNYDVGGLPDGTYRIQFADVDWFGGTTDWATEYYDDQPSLYGDGTADLVLAAGTTRGRIDATLEADSEITGTVTDVDDEPVQYADVSVQTKVGTRWQYVADARADMNGAYVVEGLRAGTYRVRFSAPLGDDYVVEWWDNVGQRANATNVVLGADASVALGNAQLVAGEHDDEVAPELVNTAPPTISGQPVVGRTLAATSGSWAPVTPTDFYYGWFRNGVYVDGSSSPTYVLTAADLGASISVGLYAGDPDSDYWYGYAESAAVGPVVAAPVVTPPVATPPVATPPAVTPATALASILGGLDVTGAPKVGRTVRITGLDASFRTAVKYKLQWYAGSKAIRKATKSKLKITSAMRGKKISVKVTATAAGAKATKKLILGKAR